MHAIDSKTPHGEIWQRISRFQQILEQKGIDGALIVQKADLLYFSGTIQQAHLYIPAQGPSILMVRKSLARACSESALEVIVPLQRLAEIPKILYDHGVAAPMCLGLELDVLPVQQFKVYQQIFPGGKMVDVSGAIRGLRAVKSAHEIDLITAAARYADQVAAAVPDMLEVGMTEVELAGRIEARARSLGHQGIVRMRLWGSELFYGHLMSGASGAVVSYLASPTGGQGVSPAVAQGPGFKTIARHEPVLVDYVFVYNGYLADHTRIFAVGGLSDELLRAHDRMLALQEMLKAAAKPGVSAGWVYEQAAAYAASHGYGDHFMGWGQEKIRFVGHGLGLELDEYPFLAKGQSLPLAENMVIALEPKLIFPGKGVVGIENTHVVTGNGLRQLTHYPQGVVTV